jgi:hypothetical protein
MHTFEKQAPMWTFGVGGKPLLGGLGGVCLRRCFLGGTGGQATKSGAFESWLFVSGSVPLTLRSVLPLSLSDLCRWPLMFMAFMGENSSSTEECLLGELFTRDSCVGLEIWCTSHFTLTSESWTGSVALKVEAYSYLHNWFKVLDH